MPCLFRRGGGMSYFLLRFVHLYTVVCFAVYVRVVRRAIEARAVSFRCSFLSLLLITAAHLASLPVTLTVS